MNKGLYIAAFHVPTQMCLRIGALGRFRFRPGLYFYVGSAQRNLQARLARHGRADKPLRWHIDYLSARAPMLGAVLIPGPRRHECHLAGALACWLNRVIPGFGASDCRCQGHLFYVPLADAPRKSATS